MIRRYLSIVSLVILTLVSCSTEEDFELPVTQADEVEILTQIESATPASRAVIGIDGKGHFEDGDKISLYVNGEQSTRTLSDGHWSPRLSWNDITGESVPFRAFYPALNHNDWKFVHTVSTNQNEGKNFEQSDLLYADEVTVNKGAKVNLNFRHLMSCLTVVVKTNDFTEEQLSKAIVKVKAYNKVDLKAGGTIGKIHDYDYDRSQMAEITFKYQGNGTFQAVMCPQGKLHYWSYGEWWLNVSIAGKTYQVKEPPANLSNGTAFNTYESGKNVTLTYNLQEIDFANKTFWVDGVQGIPDPGSDEWKFISHVSKMKHLPWKREYGWFDCSKNSTESSEPYHDMNKCWAATASNLIHWWLARNDAYIQEYCQKNGVASLSDLHIPHVYKDHHETEVFQAFRDKFTDEGGFSRLGMQWYFLGKYKNEPDRSFLLNPDIPSGGFFKDVLGENSKMSDFFNISNMKDINRALKKAFLGKKGIAFHIDMPGFGSAHEMTIWGAKFDAKGEVSTIYYVDNNDGTLGQEHIGLIEARVGTYDGKDHSKWGRACLENSSGNLVIPFLGIDLLDLREDAWKAYLGKQ